MKKIKLMLLRDIKNSKSQFIAAAAVIFVGIAMFGASLTAYRNLKSSINLYYKEYNFLDYYAYGNGITAEDVKKVQNIEGIRDVMGRISIDVTADMGKDRRVALRMITLPDSEHPLINDVLVHEGNYLEGDISNACLINKNFSDYYDLHRGDEIKVIINQVIQSLKISGIAESPEFIYAVKSPALPPSPENFGILYVKESYAIKILNSGEYFNELHVTFTDGKNRGDIIKKIENILIPRGFRHGVERKDQLSHSMVYNEINEQREIAIMFPILFLSVAAMIVYIMERRIINNQRASIGIMKAMGYSGKNILLHYIVQSLLIAMAGSIPGAMTGIFLGKILTQMYNKIFSIPVMSSNYYWDTILIGMGLSIIFCLFSAYNALKRILKIQASEAMRPESPKTGRRIFLEKIPFIWSKFPFGWKMSIRNIFRSRQRAFATALGTAITIMFMMVPLFFLDSLDYILKQQFFRFQKQDYTVKFSKPIPSDEARQLYNINGIEKIEFITEAPLQLQNGTKKEEAIVIGLVDQNSLIELVDMKGSEIKVPKTGIILSNTTAKKLSLKSGDKISIKPLSGNQEPVTISVAAIVKQYTGSTCYMNSSELQKILGSKIFTGALVDTSSGMKDLVKASLLDIPQTDMVESPLSSYRNFLKLTEFMNIFIIVMVVFGSIMGFSIIFNTTIINIMERQRELASLRVLGYSKKEIRKTIFRENLFLGFISLVPGIILGRIMCEVFSRQFSNDLFTLEVIVYPRTYVVAVLSMFIFIIFAQWANRNKVSRLDMVQVLKNREG